MDTSIRADIESSDIIARIMEEMEEVIGLIHRPSRRETSLPFLVSAEALAEPLSTSASDGA